MKTYRRRLQYYINILIGCSFLLSIVPYYTNAAKFQIRHDPLICAATGFPINLSFEIDSVLAPKEVRIYFKKQGADHFYFIQGYPKSTGAYSEMLPGPAPAVTMVEYVILVVDSERQVVRSSVFSVNTGNESDCPQYQSGNLSTPLIVSAEQKIEPETGFSGENIIWNLSEGSLRQAYFYQAREIPVQPLRGSRAQDNGVSILKKTSLNKKAAIGLGTGLGAVAVVGVVAGGGGGGSGGGSIWDDVNDVAGDITAELVKSPAIQTACGTIVTNQLFVTNNGAEDLMIGTIDYEVILTRDQPEGSCEAGRTGAFAPNWATVALPGETALIREWSNEVNPCSGCPYLIAECAWESRYIVHTSAGSAVAFGTFASEEDLCGISTTKPLDGGTEIQGDIEP